MIGTYLFFRTSKGPVNDTFTGTFPLCILTAGGKGKRARGSRTGIGRRRKQHVEQLMTSIFFPQLLNVCWRERRRRGHSVATWRDQSSTPLKVVTLMCSSSNASRHFFIPDYMVGAFPLHAAALLFRYTGGFTGPAGAWGWIAMATPVHTLLIASKDCTIMMGPSIE